MSTSSNIVEYERTIVVVQKPIGHTVSIKKNTDECPHKTQHSYSFSSMYTDLN